MKTVFIFHGVGGHPGENWFPWLKERLEEEGHRVIVPAFPRPDHPELNAWLNHFQQCASFIDADSIFIGHSLGAAFALRCLERRQSPIRATFLVSAVWGVMGNRFDPVMTSFTHEPYDWETIRRNGGDITVIHADDDPYIRLPLAEDLAKNLSVGVTLIKGAGHCNAAAGYTTFPLLLEMVRQAG